MITRRILVYITILITVIIAAPSDVQAASKDSDLTGTNPINFKHDLRIYNEYIFLNTPGEATQNVTTLEYRTPFAKGKWQFRTRVRAVDLKMDLNDDGVNEVSDQGLGDMDFRVLNVPYVDMSKGRAFAFGLEIGVPSASKDTLGSEALTFGPQVFFVKFKPFGIPGTMIVPAYQHKFSVYEESDNDNAINQGLFDLFILWASSDKQYWMNFNPQMVIDYDEDKKFGFIELEVGTMIDKYLGTKGHSTYIRPSVGVGSDRVSDHSIEVGYKFIW